MTKSPEPTSAQWRELIDRYTHSGLSRRAFCTQEGIGESTLGAWQRRLRNAASPTPETTQEPALFTEGSLQRRLKGTTRKEDVDGIPSQEIATQLAQRQHILIGLRTHFSIDL